MSEKYCKNQKCKQINPQQLTEFNKYKAAKDGLNHLCKTCIKIHNYEYYREHKQERLNYHKKYGQTKEGRENGRKGRRKYNKTEKGISAQKRYNKTENGQAIRANIDKKFRQTLKGKALHAAVQAQRRAAKLQATPKWLTSEHHKQNKEFYVLSHELQWLSERKLHVDHIIPLQGENVCGLHVPWNLQILPEPMNCSKSNKIDFNQS